MGVSGLGENVYRILCRPMLSRLPATPATPGTFGIWQVRRLKAPPIGYGLMRGLGGRHVFDTYAHCRESSSNLTDAPNDVAEPKKVEKAARRKLITNIRARDASDALRGEFVVLVFQRKALPKGRALFTAVTTTRFSFRIRKDVSYGVRALLGVDTDSA